MTATLDDVTKKIKREPTAEQKLAEELVARAREQGVSLTGPDGLLKQLTKTVLETALNQELTEHLGHDKHGPVSDRPCSRARRTSSSAASCSAVGSCLIFLDTSFSVAVISAPFRPNQRFGHQGRKHR